MRTVGAVDRAVLRCSSRSGDSLVEAPANHWKATAVAKEVMAIKYSNQTGLSITKLLEAPFAGKHPKLITKGAKAARPRRQ